MQVEKLQDDIVASHGVGDAQDAQDDAVRALASGRNFFFCDGAGERVWGDGGGEREREGTVEGGVGR